MDTPFPAELAGLISRCTGVTLTDRQLADPTKTFSDLGIDSLGLMGVLAELKRSHGVHRDVEMNTEQTPRELLAVLESEVAR